MKSHLEHALDRIDPWTHKTQLQLPISLHSAVETLSEEQQLIECINGHKPPAVIVFDESVEDYEVEKYLLAAKKVDAHISIMQVADNTRAVASSLASLYNMDTITPVTLMNREHEGSLASHLLQNIMQRYNALHSEDKGGQSL